MSVSLSKHLCQNSGGYSYLGLLIGLLCYLLVSFSVFVPVPCYFYYYGFVVKGRSEIMIPLNIVFTKLFASFKIFLYLWVESPLNFDGG